MSVLDEFETTGPASPGRVRAAGLLDLLLSVVISMLALPQPVLRASVMPSGPTPLGVALFVGLLVAAALAVYWIYLVFAVVTWGRTLAMYLLDLGLDTPTKPTLLEAALWSAGWVFAALPALLGLRPAYHPDSGLPARWSTARTRAAITQRL